MEQVAESLLTTGGQACTWKPWQFRRPCSQVAPQSSSRVLLCQTYMIAQRRLTGSACAQTSFDKITQPRKTNEDQHAVERAKFEQTEQNMTIYTCAVPSSNEFSTMAYPFSLPIPVGGPDFKSKDQERTRRVSGAPALTPLRFAHGLPRRVESYILTKWHAIAHSSIRAVSHSNDRCRGRPRAANASGSICSVRGVSSLGTLSSSP